MAQQYPSTALELHGLDLSIRSDKFWKDQRPDPPQCLKMSAKGILDRVLL